MAAGGVGGALDLDSPLDAARPQHARLDRRAGESREHRQCSSDSQERREQLSRRERLILLDGHARTPAARAARSAEAWRHASDTPDARSHLIAVPPTRAYPPSTIAGRLR